MPNILNGTGLTTATRDELITNMSAAMQAIYGTSISLASDTPDGQMLNIFVQAILDVQDLITQVYNSFNPDNAIGNVLYQRCAINGIQVQAGTFTITPITIVTSQSVNLYGLDQTAQPVYTISDAAGNLWELQTTELGVTTGTHIFNFQAALPGAITTTPNTITVQATIVLGVTSVNNPTTYTTLGINQESDAALRLRRQKSVSLASQGYLSGLLAALENISGVTSAFVYENLSSSTDVDGIPGHSIWVIVAGTGAVADIGEAIYTKRNAGCGMKGTQSYTITQVNGLPFTVYWDDVISKNLFIFFTATSLNGTVVPNIAVIRPGLVTSYVPGVDEEVDINGLATQVQIIDPNTLVTNSGFSDGTVQTLTLSGVAAAGTFLINYNGHTSAAINWNDSIGTIQTKTQAVTGLSTTLVTGSIASKTLVFTLNVDVLGLIYVTSNSLVTSGPVAITFAYTTNPTVTLTPGKQYQFVVAASNIVIVALELLPAVSNIAAGASVQFTAYGGYGTYIYSILINNSSGTINANTGAYTSGVPDALVQDTILVTDVLGNTQTAIVSVNMT